MTTTCTHFDQVRCDSSPNWHATTHHHGTGHPLIRSFQQGENWAWCHVDALPLRGLPHHEWRDTLETLHMWTQVVGKIQLALAPPVNHGWPGSEAYPKPAFYACVYPEPEGFAEAQVAFGGAYHADLREFVLPWPQSGGAEPDAEGALAFLRSAYSAAADLGGWDRGGLEPR